MQFSQLFSCSSECQFSPNSEFFAYMNQKSLIIKQNTIDLKNHKTIQLQNLKQSSNIILKFSPNSKSIAVLLKNKNLVQIWSIQGKLCSIIEDNSNQIEGIVWAPDSIQLLVFSPFQIQCSIYNLNNQTTTIIKKNKAIDEKGIVFFRNNKFMAMLEKHQSKDTVGVYCAETWTMLNHIPLETYDSSEIIATKSGFLIVIDNKLSFKVIIVHPYTGVVAKINPYDYGLGVSSIQISKNDMFLAIGSYDQKVRIYNTLTWKLITQLDCSSLQINTLKTKVYKDQGNINNIALKCIQRKGSFTIQSIKNSNNDKEANSRIADIQISPQSQYLACKNYLMPNTIFIWSLLTLELDTVINLSMNIKTFLWNTNQNSLMIAYGGNNLILWNANQDQIYEINLNDSPTQKIKFSIDRIKFSPNQSSLFLIDKQKRVILAQFTDENQQQQ